MYPCCSPEKMSVAAGFSQPLSSGLTVGGAGLVCGVVADACFAGPPAFSIFGGSSALGMSDEWGGASVWLI